MKLYDQKTIGGILLVAGTTIGAGMLALPVSTGQGGFFGAAILFVLCFLFMLLTLFMLLEANLYEKNPEANIISMAKKHLGPFGQAISWVAYLGIFYSVTAAYLSASGSLVANFFVAGAITDTQSLIGTYSFLFVFGTIVFFGAWLVDYVNRGLMLGLIGSYIALVMFVTPKIQVANLFEGDPKILLGTITIVILSFTSHLILPSLRLYLRDNVKEVSRALFFGSLVPLVFYLFWEFTILGVVPIHGEGGLADIANSAKPLAALTQNLAINFGLHWAASVVGFFSFFALVTSFLAVVLCLNDFLADGFQIKKTLKGRFILILMSLIPPLLFAIYAPSGFLFALSYAGVFIAVLFGIIPAMIVWKVRYIEKSQDEVRFRLPGGKPVVIFVITGSVVIIFFQVASTLGWLT